MSELLSATLRCPREAGWPIGCRVRTAFPQPLLTKGQWSWLDRSGLTFRDFRQSERTTQGLWRDKKVDSPWFQTLDRWRRVEPSEPQNWRDRQKFPERRTGGEQIPASVRKSQNDLRWSWPSLRGTGRESNRAERIPRQHIGSRVGLTEPIGRVQAAVFGA